MAFRRTACTILPLLPLLLLSGCCSLSRLFCGPDDSRWVSISYGSPTATVATLLEAIRRDAPDVVYDCLAAEFRRQNQLGSVEAQVMWERLKDQVPGLHLAGYAKIPAPETIADAGATFVIDVEGHRLRIAVVRESFREVEYRRPDGSVGLSQVPLASWNTLANIESISDDDFDKSRLTILPLEFEHEGLVGVPLGSVQRAGLVRLWKVSALQTLQ